MPVNNSCKCHRRVCSIPSIEAAAGCILVNLTTSCAMTAPLRQYLKAVNLYCDIILDKSAYEVQRFMHGIRARSCDMMICRAGAAAGTGVPKRQEVHYCAQRPAGHRPLRRPHPLCCRLPGGDQHRGAGPQHRRCGWQGLRTERCQLVRIRREAVHLIPSLLIIFCFPEPICNQRSLHFE